MSIQIAHSTPPGPVVFVNFSASWGGGEKWHLVSAQELRKRGYQVVIFGKQASALHQQAVQHGLPCRACKLTKHAFLNPLKLYRILRILTDLHPWTVILNGSLELKTAGVMAKFANVPRIIYRRGLPLKIRPTLLNRALFKYIVTDIIVDSQNSLRAVQEIARKTGKKSPEIIYSGVDVTRHAQAAPESRKIGVVARLSYEKGVDLALHVLAALKTQRPAIQLRIIGDGPERRPLEHLAAQLGLQQAVEFIGFTNNVPEYLRECALLLLPSRWESFGYALLEAMLLHMPCVAFDNGSAGEIIEHGVTGYIVEKENIAQMAAVILDLMQAPAKIRAMGAAGYARVCTHFPLPKTIDQLEQLLQPTP